MIAYSVWYLVAHSDRMSIVILLILLLLSIITWSVGIFCIRFFNREMKDFSEVLSLLHACVTKNELERYYFEKKMHNTTLSLADMFIVDQLSKIQRIHTIVGVCTEASCLVMRDCIDTELYRSVDEYLETKNSYASVFATIAGVSPLLGLLGTVWGLIHAFLEISQTQVADLASVAPGISEALITTLAGLIVAIPALIFANIVHSKIAQLSSVIEESAVHYRMIVFGSLTKDSDASEQKK